MYAPAPLNLQFIPGTRSNLFYKGAKFYFNRVHEGGLTDASALLPDFGVDFSMFTDRGRET